jgi:hypothetical protein
MDDVERERWEKHQHEHGFVRVHLRLLTSAEGGRKGPIADGYRACWDIGNRYEGGSGFNDAPLLLDGRGFLAPGESANVRISPLLPQHWTQVTAGAEIAMYEGSRMVGRGTVVEVIGIG